MASSEKMEEGGVATYGSADIGESLPTLPRTKGGGIASAAVVGEDDGDKVHMLLVCCPSVPISHRRLSS